MSFAMGICLGLFSPKQITHIYCCLTTHLIVNIVIPRDWFRETNSHISHTSHFAQSVAAISHHEDYRLLVSSTKKFFSI